MTKDEAAKMLAQFVLALRQKDTEYIDIGHSDEPMKSQFFHEDSVYCIKRYVSRRLFRQVMGATSVILDEVQVDETNDR